MFRKHNINWTVVRIIAVGSMFAMAAIVLTARAYRLQVIDSQVLKKRAEKQRSMNINLESRRGFIFDRSGEQLAASLEVDSVYARPRKISSDKARGQVAENLSKILDMDKNNIEKKLEEEKPFVWIK
ncbi:MAG: hypothetical protein ACP5U1_02020, partial [Desulfomonilaceae bacterium]